ncbi:MAG: 16S rRNA (guanine(527)-N(7))-methyltransferase RsmG [Bacilli bacterium]
MDKLETYYDFLVSENKKYNLTAITDKEEVYIKHFEDSLSVDRIIDLNNINSICDVGSGAGFPGVVIKIKYPHLKLTIIEPTAKRCNFLSQLVLKLGLKDVIIINGRAEDMKNLRSSFDLVVARAVSSLPILLELCIPLVKVKGYFVALKGSNYSTEVEQSKRALKLLDSSIDECYEYELSNNYGTHSLIKIYKKMETNIIYPRLYKDIKSKPL